MKKNDVAKFSIAQRQSPFALLFIAGDSLRRLVSSFWPLLLVYFIGSSTSWFDIYLIFIATISILISLSMGVLKYWRYTYHIAENKFIINQGVFRRSRTSIPFDRIQIVRIDEKVFHRWTHTSGLTIETAGTSTDELEIKALPYADARELHAFLMPKGKKNHARNREEAFDESQEEKLVIKHSIFDTLKIGFTQNHLKSAWYIAASFLFLFSQVYEYIGDRIINTVLDSYESIFTVNLIVSTGIILFIIVASILISMGTSILRYFGLQVVYADHLLKVKSGLFNRKEQTVKQNRIQLYREVSNPLRRLIDILSINIHQPVSSSDMQKSSISIAGIRYADVDTFRAFALQETQFLNPISIDTQPVVIQRRMLYFALVPILILLVPGYYFFTWNSLFLLLFIPIIYLLIRVWYGKLRLDICEDHIVRSGGVFNTFNVFTDYSKIQNVSLSQTPFQSRKSLCNITIYTAGGSLSYPYITLEDGEKLRDYLLYRLESESREWM